MQTIKNLVQVAKLETNVFFFALLKYCRYSKSWIVILVMWCIHNKYEARAVLILLRRIWCVERDNVGFVSLVFVDIDYCQPSLTPCDENAICEDLPPPELSATCRCHAGYFQNSTGVNGTCFGMSLVPNVPNVLPLINSKMLIFGSKLLLFQTVKLLNISSHCKFFHD